MPVHPPPEALTIQFTPLTRENNQDETKAYKTTKSQREDGGERGKNKAITLQLGDTNHFHTSFYDKVLDNESDEDGDDGEDHQD